MGLHVASPTMEVPKTDFNGLRPGTAAWDAARGKVMTSLDAWGCFQAVYDRYTPKLSAAFFGGAADELFGLALETKMKNTSALPMHGYIGGIPCMPCESLCVNGAPSLEDAEAFTRLMWPNGNPRFCTELEDLRCRQVTENGSRLNPLRTPSLSWLANRLRLWTNGRIRAVVHRVKLEGNEKRYSTVFGSRPKNIVQTPEELVDEEHALLFKPYDYNDYLRFRFSDTFSTANEALMAYCGAIQEELKTGKFLMLS